MRILQVITRADSVGGAQIHVLHLCGELVKRGHEVHVAAGPGTDYPAALRRAGCVFHPVDTLGNSLAPARVVRSFFALRRLIRELGPDLVCGHSSVAGILSKMAAASADVPSVFTAHGWSFTEGNRMHKRVLAGAVERVFSGFNARIICVSEHDRVLAEKIGIPIRKLVTIRNGVPGPKASPGASKPEKKGFVVVMVARFAAPKRQQDLVRAAALVPGVEVRFVGSGPTEGAAKDFVGKLKLGERVKFLGWREDVESILGDADVFCLLSDFEGFPMTIIEAMRGGLPCIVSDVGGCGEAVLEGETGYLVPVGDVLAMADRLNRLKADPASTLRMARAGRLRFEAFFTLQNMVDETLEVYRGVLRPGRGGSGNA